MLARVWGIGRSLLIYYGMPGRQRGLRRLYGEFLKPGDLGFDLGAHVGSRVRAWRGLGVRVVAVEPQPDFVRVLQLLFGRDPNVVILPRAIGAYAGTAQLSISTTTPTVSSLSPDWIGAVGTDRRFGRVRWDRAVEVEMITLDNMIMNFGEPSFVKIDVEGSEVDVLRGLSRPVAALSFEYLPPTHDDALAALALVDRLGDYAYNYSPVETHRYASDRWLNATELERLLDRIRPGGRSGDIYARRVDRS